MSITIKNEETDRLVRELAEMRGISPVKAVHEAVQAKLAQERREEVQVIGPWSSDYDDLLESYPGDAAIIAIDELRMEVARSYGMDNALDKLSDGVWPVAAMMTLGLYLVPFFERPRYSLVFAILVIETILMITYWRHLSRKNEAREQRRKHLANEIQSLCASLPEGLMFLSRIPERDPDYEVLERSAAGLPAPTTTNTRIRVGKEAIIIEEKHDSKAPSPRYTLQYYRRLVQRKLDAVPGAAGLVTPEQLQNYAQRLFEKDLGKAAKHSEEAHRSDIV